MRVYVNRTLPFFSYIVLLACLGEVGHSAGAPFGTHVLNGKGLKINVAISDLFPFKLNHGNVCHEMLCQVQLMSLVMKFVMHNAQDSIHIATQDV